MPNVSENLNAATGKENTMKPLFSIHQINMTETLGKAGTRDTPAVPPKEIIIAPGKAFHALNEEDHEFFLKQGAARLATAEEARDLEPSKEEKAAAKKAAADAAKAADAKNTGKAADKGAADGKGDDDGKGLV